MKEKEESVILYLSMLQDVAKNLREIAYKYKTENKELSRQLSDIIVKIDKYPFQNPCLILKGHIEDGKLTINEMTVWQHKPDFYQTITKVDGDFRDRSGTLYINMKDEPVINFVRTNVISEFITEQIQSGLLPKLNRSCIEETSINRYPRRIGVYKKLTEEDVKLLSNAGILVDATIALKSLKKIPFNEAHVLIILEKIDKHIFQYENILIVSHPSQHVNYLISASLLSAENLIVNCGSYINLFRKLGFVFNKSNDKENEDRLQEQETVRREGYTRCVLSYRCNFPRCSVGHLRNKERVEIKATRVTESKAIVSTRCPKVLTA